tara:strand:- start:6988 stop:8034 length:1047 start_codon:yes stop_codon:yes gene_type:complete
MGIIVWILQAVNYFDYVSQDGHGLKTYFTYILLNFPKIIHRIIPFIFFVSLFYVLNRYEIKNELLIFWTHGITKLNFANNVLFISIILTIFQIWFGSFLSPFSQLKGRELLKNSNIDFFTSLMKEGKFLNIVEGLTIFINEENQNGNYSKIFIDDSSKNISRMIYAKKGILIDDKSKKIFRLYDGRVINNDKTKINIFEFDRIDLNLAEYTSNSILVPKIQETPSRYLLGCSIKILKNNLFFESKKFKCDQKIKREINQELLKRFFKPLYIPLIAILSCFLIITPKNNYKYERNKRITFLITFLLLVISEVSLRYSAISTISIIAYLIFPLISFFIIYLIFYRMVKNA